MKHIILGLVSILSLSCNKNIPKKNNKLLQSYDLTLQDNNLKGKVKYIREITYDVTENFGEIQKGDIKKLFISDNFYTYVHNISISFDKNGNKIENKIYSSNDTPTTITYKYDKYGNMIEENNKGISHYKSTFHYDNKRNLIEFNSYLPDNKLSSKIKYKYDDKGNNIETSSYLPNGNLEFKIIYSIDSNDNIISSSSYDIDGNLAHKIFLKYDENNNKIEEISRNTNYYLKKTYNYDNNGNITQENVYDDEGNSYFTAYSYDNYQNIIEDFQKNYDPSSFPIYKYIYKYIYTYKYDSHGNWIQRIKYDNIKNNIKKPIDITERTIEYYD